MQIRINQRLTIVDPPDRWRRYSVSEYFWRGDIGKWVDAKGKSLSRCLILPSEPRLF
jgi:hypothetical protein